MKTHILILGGIYTFLCGLALALGLALCVTLWLDPSTGSQTALQYIGPPLLFVACVVLVPGLVGGIGLLYFRPWARVVLLFPSLLFVFLLPLGTALAVYALWTLRNEETRALLSGAGSAASSGSPSYQLSPMPSLHSPLFSLLLVMACVAAGFFLVIKIGFLLHGEPLPSPFDSNALTGISTVVLFAGVARGTVSIIQYVTGAITGARIRRESNASASVYQEARRLRVAELAADPARAKYAPLVERGEDWSEENIAYYEDGEMTVTCAHLEPIERAMRRAGVDVRRYRKQDVSAKCCIDFAALEQTFMVASPVRYSEFYEAERYEYDHPLAYLICDEHQSLIHTVHPEASGTRELPLFPSVGE